MIVHVTFYSMLSRRVRLEAKLMAQPFYNPKWLLANTMGSLPEFKILPR